MHTPYEILQLKQKEKRKIISEHKKQRAFTIKSNKNGLNSTTYHIEKDKPPTPNRYQTIPIQSHQQNKCSTSQKKYEIIFRESIRKVNTYRTKVYHTHAALKRQTFVNRLFATPRESHSPRYKEFVQNYSKVHSNRQEKTKAKTCDPEKQCETLNVGKYRIYFVRSPQKPNHNQIMPEFSVEKCKLNITDNEYKQKIQKTLQSLYKHNKKMEMTMKNISIDSFTERDNFSQETQRKNSIFNCFDSPEKFITTLKSPRSTNDLKKQEIRLLKKGQTFMNSIYEQKIEAMDDKKVANFIRNKKKKRLPISTLRGADNNEFEFKRTITDSLAHKLKRQNFLKNTCERYYSPNKRTRCGARIKFNSIEENISGWEFQPFQSNQVTLGTKSPLIDY